MICCDRFFIFLSLATLAPHQPLQNRTIPYLALNLPPLSKVRCCRPKEFGRLPKGLPQLHRPSPSPQPLQKDNSTLLRTKLASLVKGEVPSPEKIRATTGGIATPTFRSALTFPKPHYPSKIANTLASLVKGEVLSPEKIRATTGGIATPTFRSAPTFQKTALSLAPHHILASLVKGEVLLPEKIRAATGGIVLHPPTSPSPQPLQKDNNPSPHVCPFIIRQSLTSLFTGSFVSL